MREKRALVVAPRAPDFDRGSGSQRVFDFIDWLQEAGWSVSFAAGGWCLERVPRQVRLEERYARVLQQRGIPTYAGLDFRAKAMIREGHFDLAVLAYFHVAEAWMPTIRKLSPTTRIIVDNLDLSFVRLARQRFLQRETPGEVGLLDEEYASQTTRELNVYAAADLVLAVSAKEAALVDDLIGESGLAWMVPDGEALTPSPIPFAQRRGILFVGGYTHPPNLDAATYLCTMIAPQLDPQLTLEHPIYLVGDGLDRVQHLLGHPSSHIRKVGWVPTVVPYLEQARVSVMPLPYGAGTKRKVIQALMVGTPAVATSMATEGLDLQDGTHLLVADDPRSFAHAITRVLQDEALWHQLARHGSAHMRSIRSRVGAQAAFLQAVEAVLAKRPKAGDRARQLERYRLPTNLPYVRQLQEMRAAVQEVVPQTAIVLVVSGDDQALLNLGSRVTRPFPPRGPGQRAEGGTMSSAELLTQVEALAAQGAAYLLIPAAALGWLDQQAGLKQGLEERYALKGATASCLLFALQEAPVVRGRPLINGDGLEAQQPAESEAGGDGALPPTLPQVAASPMLQHLQARMVPCQVLVLGTYQADDPPFLSQVVRTLARTERCQVRQRWVAIGGAPPSAELEAATVLQSAEWRPRYVLLNSLLTREDLGAYDYVLTLTDDVLLPADFIDLFLALQQSVAFALAQPALTASSTIDLPLVEQQRGVLARQTMLVQPEPVASFHRSIYDLVFPFHEISPLGVGYDTVWAYRLHNHHTMGIIDAVPVVRRGRPSSHQKRDALEGSALLRQFPHLPLDHALQVVATLDLEHAEAGKQNR